VRVEIFWPVTGKTQVVTGLAMDRCYAIREGEAAPREVTLPHFAWPENASTATHHQHHMMPEAGKK
jgi:hypothetical protein